MNNYYLLLKRNYSNNEKLLFIVTILAVWPSPQYLLSVCNGLSTYYFIVCHQITSLDRKRSLSGRRMFFEKKGGQGGFEPPTSRTQSENHTPRPLALMCELNLEGFEPPTFGSGIRRATIAP